MPMKMGFSWVESAEEGKKLKSLRNSSLVEGSSTIKLRHSSFWASASSLWISLNRYWMRCFYSEVYNSDTFIEEYIRIHSQPQPDCNLETIVTSILLWWDSTHLTSFSNALLWSSYLFFGNQLKYTRGKPTSFAGHHMAYIPKVSMFLWLSSMRSDSKSYYLAWRHCSRFLSKRVWQSSYWRCSHTSSSWAHACNLAAAAWWWIYGCISIWDCNHISRWHLSLHFSIYSADYPEKCVYLLVSCKDATQLI